MCGTCSASELPLQQFQGGTLKEGKATCSGHYYRDGVVLEFPEKPSAFHTWDWVTLAWFLDQVLAENIVREKRDGLLRNVVDSVNAVRWSAMDDADRSIWRTYRTALLNITDQTGFPFSIVWPTAPTQQ